jgi:hypothetical protein
VVIFFLVGQKAIHGVAEPACKLTVMGLVYFCALMLVVAEWQIAFTELDHEDVQSDNTLLKFTLQKMEQYTHEGIRFWLCQLIVWGFIGVEAFFVVVYNKNHFRSVKPKDTDFKQV